MAWIGNVSNIQNGADVIQAIDYVVRDSKTRRVKIGKDDSVDNHFVYSTVPILNVNNTKIIDRCWGNTRKAYGKDDKILCHHFVQSINPAHKVTPEESFEIVKAIAEKIFGSQGFDYVVSTHIDKDVIHNHILVNNVSKTTGKKYMHNTHTYWDMRKDNIDICRLHGINAVDTGRMGDWKEKEFDKMLLKGDYSQKINTGRVHYKKTSAYYRHARKEKSHKATLKRDINETIKYSTSWEDFVINMQRKGYKIDDKKKNGEDKKYVTYLVPGAERGTRDRNLEPKYSKDAIKERIEKRLERELRREEYLLKKKEQNISYHKERVEKELARYRVLQKKKIDKEFYSAMYGIKRIVRGNFRGIRIYRMSYAEQNCRLQYERYKVALVKYEAALREKSETGSEFSAAEVERMKLNIQDSITDVAMIRKYYIGSNKDIKNARLQISEKIKSKKENIWEIENRINRIEKRISALIELKELAPVAIAYDMLHGQSKEEYQDEHLSELQRYYILKRELEKSKPDIRSIDTLDKMKKQLEKSIQDVEDEISDLEKDNLALNNMERQHEKEKNEYER